MENILRGMLFGILLLISSTCGVVVYNPALIPLLLLVPGAYRATVDTLVASWLTYCVALLEILLGIRVVLTGDQIEPGERSLIMMNHRTRLDWMYLWSVLLRHSSLATEKIILKKGLKHIPGAGWAMQCAGFIFIERKWDEDRHLLSDTVDYLSGLKHNTQVVLFPEGTDLTQRTKARSDEFARKNGLEPYTYVLHPRTTGFTYLAHKMSSVNHLDAVYDVTIAYPYNCPQTEPELVCGNFPREVHFNIRRYTSGDLPQSEDGLKDWCCQRWADKEARLHRFGTDRCFTETTETGRGTATAGRKGTERNNNQSQPLFIMYIALIYWTLFVSGCILFLVYSSWARWYALIVVAIYIAVGYKGGLDTFQVYWYNRFFNKKRQ